MSGEREQRALDALIVSQFRACDETSMEHLPELTDDERKTLDALGADFVERLLGGNIVISEDESIGTPELAAAGEAFGMNRAERIEEQTKEELDQKRKEIIDRLKQKERGNDKPNT